MREFQRKRVLRKFLYSRVTLFFLLLALVFFIKSSIGAFENEKKSRANLQNAQDELAALQARQALLEGKIKRFQTPEGIEAEIREQFQVAKPGEKMVVVVEEKSAAENGSEPKQSFISRFFDLFR